MSYINELVEIRNNVDKYFIVLLSLILVSNILDWGLGWTNAKLNKSVMFISSEALYGIVKKMMYFIVLIFFGVIALIIIPKEISIPAITFLYLGYLASELNSILSHFNLTEDGKKGELFSDFLGKIFKGKEE